jgi:hypothetical protein
MAGTCPLPNPDKPEKILHRKGAKVAKFFRKQFRFSGISLSFATLAVDADDHMGMPVLFQAGVAMGFNFKIAQVIS